MIMKHTRNTILPLASHKRPIGKRLQRSIDIFLNKNRVSSRPLLLGFSGGHDSRALWELLIAYKKKRSLSLIVAHIDHGWRSESQQEALQLKELVESHGCLFFLHILEKDQSGKNLEEKGRQERYAFFEKLYHEHQCEALLLGQQADDQAETVLKRIFEGAHFTSLSAMRSVSTWEEMTIWRPLLEVTREEVLTFLWEKQIVALDDRSNYDPSFLRARMRANMLPYLEEMFGKKFRENLLELSKSFQAIENYFEEKTIHYAKSEKSSPEGVSLDFSTFVSLSLLEKEVAVKRFLLKEGLRLGTRHLRQIVELLNDKVSNKKLLIKKRHLVINGGQLFVKSFKSE